MVESRVHGTLKRHETHFVWQGLRLLQEQDINTGKCQTYCYEEHGSYTPLAVIVKQPSGYHYYWHHCDINSAPLDVTNAQGNTVWSGKYERFGFVRNSPLSFYSDPEREMESFEQNLRYAGQYFDNETGLHFNTFRFYDPQIGRFIMPDPIGLLGGINLYQYAPNPLGWIDPWGLTQALIYENPGHHEPGYLPGRQVPFNSSKSIIPPNAEELFKLSQLDPNDPKTSWVKIGNGKRAVWHKFQSSAADGSGPFHWNGSTDGIDIKGKPRTIDPRNVPKYAKNMEGIKPCK